MWGAVVGDIAGSRFDGTRAVTAYRNALEEHSQDDVPLNWAGTQNSLGRALLILGEHKGSRTLLERAENAHAAAMTVLDAGGPTQYRDMVQRNLDEVRDRLRNARP